MCAGASFFRQLHAQEGSTIDGSSNPFSLPPISSLLSSPPPEASWGALWAAVLHASLAHRGLLMLVMLHVRQNGNLHPVAPNFHVQNVSAAGHGTTLCPPSPVL